MSPSSGGCIVDATPPAGCSGLTSKVVRLGPNKTDETATIGQNAANGLLDPERQTQPDPFRGNDRNYEAQTLFRAGSANVLVPPMTGTYHQNSK